jgi:hypothetical protein
MYEVDEATLMRDLTSLTNDWLEKGLVEERT